MAHVEGSGTAGGGTVNLNFSSLNPSSFQFPSGLLNEAPMSQRLPALSL